MDEVDFITAQSYRLRQIEVIQKEIELERDKRDVLIKKCRMNFGFNLPSEIIPTRIAKFLSKLSKAVTF